MNLSYKQRVRNGAEFLDSFRPGWWQSVDTSILDVTDGDACVLGQVFDSWDLGCDEISASGTDPWAHNWQADRGFNVTREESMEGDVEASKIFRWLNKRWTEEINARKGASK